jgi:spore coat polysaccharide biosynthesis protein SpsF (cytidylyltransferase family)
MSSSSFPGNVLDPFAGLTVIESILQRLEASKFIDCTIVATSKDETDDKLTEILEGHLVYRGDLDDVRSRFIELSMIYEPELIVRITADCPLTCGSLVDQVIKFHLESGAEYTANCNVDPYPKGFDVEVFNAEVLTRESFLTDSLYEKEHVTPWMYQEDNLNVQNFRFIQSSSSRSVNFSVDTLEDLIFLTLLEEKFSVSKFSFEEIWARVGGIQGLLGSGKCPPEL